MDTVTLYMNNSSVWTYELVNNVEAHIYMQDQRDYTQLRLDKDANKLYVYDIYNGVWKCMENTSKLLDRVEINKIEEV